MKILIVDGTSSAIQRLDQELSHAGHVVSHRGSLKDAADFDLTVAGLAESNQDVVGDLISRVGELDFSVPRNSPFVIQFRDGHYVMTIPNCRGLLGAISRHLVEVCGAYLPASSRDHFNTAVCEALQNALIHGNLEISSELRDQGNWDTYEALIGARLMEPDYAQRSIRVDTHCDTQRLTIQIEDDGPGFDPSNLPDPLEPEALLRASGRGITMIRFAMDEVSWNARGNRIEMTKYYDAA